MELLEKMEKAKELLDFALKIQEISRAKLIQTKDVVVDERVRFQCSFSGCREYGKRLMCPPNTPEVEDFRKLLFRYFMAMLVQVEGTLTDKENWLPETDELTLKLHEAVYKIEKKAFSLGFPFAAGLIGGPCKLCDKCAGLQNSTCIHREKARPSMEGLGIDVMATCKNAGWDLAFSPDKVVWTGLVLLD